MVLWPFVPGARCYEWLGWLTDVMRSIGAEQRVALLPEPRQGFSFLHVLDDSEAERARALVEVAGPGPWGVPIWPEHTRLGVVSAGATVLAFDTAHADYRVGHALLWDDEETCEIVEVESVSGSELVLAAPVVNNYTAAVVAPLREGYASQGLQLERIEPDLALARIEFEIHDGADLADETGLDVYDGLPVLTTVSKLGGGLDNPLVREAQRVDNDTSPAWFRLSRSRARESLAVRWDADTRAEVWSVRQWLHARKGRALPFWLPSWGRDLELLAPIGAADTQITVRAAGWADGDGPRDIMLRTVAGVRYYRRVTAAVPGGSGQELLTIAALGASVSVQQMDRICRLHRMCQAADRVEIDHRAGLGAAVSVLCEEVPAA